MGVMGDERGAEGAARMGIGAAERLMMLLS
jgi:hypothetical protein